MIANDLINWPNAGGGFVEPGLGLGSALNSVRRGGFGGFNAVTSEDGGGGRRGGYSKSGGRNLTKQASVAISELGRES